ncbi:MAG TPA: hypothetical protein VG961_10425, partial [Ignavibacteria bacterium]|nr:hypothetical protein [Ignavibacteria bacterium]
KLLIHTAYYGITCKKRSGINSKYYHLLLLNILLSEVTPKSIHCFSLALLSAAKDSLTRENVLEHFRSPALAGFTSSSKFFHYFFINIGI